MAAVLAQALAPEQGMVEVHGLRLGTAEVQALLLQLGMAVVLEQVLAP